MSSARTVPRSRFGVRAALAVSLLLIAVTGCSSSEVSPPIERCTEPPQSALSETGDFVVELSPNPVAAGEQAVLSVSYTGDGGTLDGAGAEWQCWTGSDWESTHQLLKDWTGDGPGTRYIEPGTEVTVPAIGLPIPDAYTVLIPDVPSGTYRVYNEGVIDGEPAPGYATVTVE